MKKYSCIIDLHANVLKMNFDNESIVVPFLSEREVN